MEVDCWVRIHGGQEVLAFDGTQVRSYLCADFTSGEEHLVKNSLALVIADQGHYFSVSVNRGCWRGFIIKTC